MSVEIYGPKDEQLHLFFFRRFVKRTASHDSEWWSVFAVYTTLYCEETEQYMHYDQSSHIGGSCLPAWYFTAYYQYFQQAIKLFPSVCNVRTDCVLRPNDHEGINCVALWHADGIWPFYYIVLLYLIFNFTANIFQILSRREGGFATIVQTSELGTPSGPVRKENKEAAEMWEISAAVHETRLHATYLYL